MSDELPPDVDPGTDPEELERVMLLAAKDVALHGPFFRLLMEARVWIFVPPHPELVSHARDQTDPITWQEYGDAQGKFAPVFTSAPAAEQRAEQLPPPVPMMMELPARVLFAHLHSAGSTALLCASHGATFRLPPEVLGSLFRGEWTEAQPDRTPGEKVRLRAVPPEEVPAELREAIREFCTQRQGAIQVNVFHPIDPEKETYNPHDLRVFVRLRDQSGHFYNDFRLLAARVTPKPYEVSIGVANGDDEEGMAFIQRCPPVWPVIAEE